MDNLTYQPSHFDLEGNQSFSEDPDMVLPEIPTRWGFWVKFILTPVIVCAGLVGNTLSLIVMQSKPLRHKSYSRYLSALAVFDTLTLLIRQIHQVDEYYAIETGENAIFNGFDTFGCKIFNFLEHVSYLMSSWLIVVMALERLVAVCMPFRAPILIRTPTGAIITIVIMCVVICLSQTFRLVMIEFSEEYNCSTSYSFLRIYTDLHVYFYQWSLAFVLPVTLVIGCNCVVLYQIFKIKQEIRKEDKPANFQSRSVRKRHRTTCMLLIVSFTFLGTLLPLMLLTLIVDIYLKVDGGEGYAFYIKALSYIDLAVTLSLVNYAVNFFIYILSGKSFRFELRKVFRRRRYTRRSFTARSTREEFFRLGHMSNGSLHGNQ